ncbi:regulatory protein, luxR family [Streptomyces sp. Ag82_O1-12]|uniref:LuxR C-terminal-related transcriptional regulator n=1 Tax=unclassified Streptomyces TaxID=2593676 RepID=UPI000BD50BE2|nr:MULTISPECIES: LuxR family transcriptional regulator [unclassified Streptomyces]SMQ14589.1 regulatory protein, luxR family [Streptomyces sp. Ag82_O1-12]SOD43616.1 regulatory protein, luxR family [Streptomyces sp. Ag82_G6-1]
MTTLPLAPPWPLVGRADELGEVTGLLSTPHTRGIVISGPTGAGKTRLAHEAWEWAGRRGHPVVRAAATRASRSVPLGALAPLLSPRPRDRVALHVRRPRPAGGPEQHRPVLLIDDVHLLDDASAELLRPLLASGELLLIATTSAEGSGGTAGGRIAEDLHPVNLRPLSGKVVQSLLEDVLRGPVERRTARLLHGASGGRPLYLKELVTGALTGGELVCETGLWRLAATLAPPPRLVELVRYRLSTIGEPGRAVLEDLALCGPDALIHFPRDVVESLCAAGLIRIHGSGREAVAELADPLDGEVLRTTVPVHRSRRTMLARAERTETGGGPADAELLRSTLWRLDAAAGVPPERLTAAVELARAVHDFPAALRLAGALVRVRPDALSHLLLGEFRHACGYPEDAEQALARALELATTPDERLLGVVLRTQNLAQGLLRTGEAFEVNAAELRNARDPAIQAVLSANEASLWTLIGDIDRAGALLESVAAEGGDRSALIAAVPSVYCLSEAGRPDEALAAAERRRERPECARADSVAHPALLQSAGARALAEAGRLKEAESLAHQAYDHAVDTRAVTAQIRSATDLGWICYLQGSMTRARYWFASVVSCSRDQGFLSGLWAGLAGRALVDAVTGHLDDSDDAWAEARRMLPDRWQRPECLLVEAWRTAALGRLGEARAVLRTGAQSAAGKGLLTLASHLLFDIARLGDAHGALTELTELADRCPNPFIALRARTARALAADAGDELERCAQDAESMGALLVAAETWTAVAGTHTASGAHRKAARCRAEAERLAAHCRASTPGLTPHAVRDSLTGREMEIALLAASGLGNAQIAEQLALSVRTVGNHLQRVYSKIGIRGRRLLKEALRRQPVLPGEGVNRSRSAGAAIVRR